MVLTPSVAEPVVAQRQFTRGQKNLCCKWCGEGIRGAMTLEVKSVISQRLYAILRVDDDGNSVTDRSGQGGGGRREEGECEAKIGACFYLLHSVWATKQQCRLWPKDNLYTCQIQICVRGPIVSEGFGGVSLCLPCVEDERLHFIARSNHIFKKCKTNVWLMMSCLLIINMTLCD